MLAFARRVLNGDNDDFLGRLVDHVIDKIGIGPRHQLANALDLLLPSDLRKQNKVLKRSKDSGAHAQRRLGIPFSKVIGDFAQIPHRSRREEEFNRSKRRKAASISASVEKWCRVACARPSSTAARWAGSTSSGSPSLPLRLSIASAI